MIHQVLDNIYKIELPIPFPLKTMNVYFIDDTPRTLLDTWVKTKGSFEIFLGISEAVGHLDILKEKGIVQIKEKEGKDYYSLVT